MTVSVYQSRARRRELGHVLSGAELCACRGCFPTQESDLDFGFPLAMKGFRRQMLPVPAGGNVSEAVE